MAKFYAFSLSSGIAFVTFLPLDSLSSGIAFVAFIAF
jgi:hypothetical protein